MATFEIQSPDGNTYEINAPDNATEEQVMQYAQENFKAPEKAPKSFLMSTVTEAVKAALPGADFNKPIAPKSGNTIMGAVEAAGQTLRDPTRIESTLAQPGRIVGDKIGGLPGEVAAIALNPSSYIGGGAGAPIAKNAAKEALNIAGPELASLASGASNVPIRAMKNFFKNPMSVLKSPNSKEAGAVLQKAKELAGVTREEEFLIAKAADRAVGGARTVAEDLRPRFEATKGLAQAAGEIKALTVGELVAFNRAVGKLAGEAKGSEKALWSGVKAAAQKALETRATKIAEALETYALSKTKDAFKSIFPKTKDGRADFFKTLGAGLSFGLTSPLAIGAGTLLAKGASKILPTAAGVAGMGSGAFLTGSSKNALDVALQRLKDAQ